MNRFWNKVDKTGDCWEWTRATSQGYGAFLFNGRIDGAHRVSWVLRNGPIPEGLYVLHTCDNRRCVRPDHLFLGTHQDNIADMVSKGRHRQGPHTYKLTKQQVVEIKSLLPSMMHKDIAKLYGVSRSAITQINTGVTWSHI